MEHGLGNACVGDALYNPMMMADAKNAAHRLANVVDATMNTKKPLWSSTNESRVVMECSPNVQERQEREADEDQENRDECLEASQTSIKNNSIRLTEVIGYLSKASATNLVVGAITPSSNLRPGVTGLAKIGRKSRILRTF